MRPEDLLEALEGVGDSMLLEAQNVKKQPRNLLKWVSVAACFLCGLLVLGLVFIRLWGGSETGTRSLNQEREPKQEQETAAAIPSEDQEASEPETESLLWYDPHDWHLTGVGAYLYYIAPEGGLYCFSLETKESQLLVDIEDGEILEADDGIYCLNQETGDLYEIHGNTLSVHIAAIQTTEPAVSFTLISVEGDIMYWSSLSRVDSLMEAKQQVFMTDLRTWETTLVFEPDFDVYSWRYLDGKLYCDDFGTIWRYDIASDSLETLYVPPENTEDTQYEVSPATFYQDFILVPVWKYVLNQEGGYQRDSNAPYQISYDGEFLGLLPDTTTGGMMAKYKGNPVYILPDETEMYTSIWYDVATGERRTLELELPAACEAARESVLTETGIYFVGQSWRMEGLQYFDFTNKNFEQIAGVQNTSEQPDVQDPIDSALLLPTGCTFVSLGRFFPCVKLGDRYYRWKGLSVEACFQTADTAKSADGKIFTKLPAGFKEAGELCWVGDAEPTADFEIAADFELSGTVYTNAVDKETIYAKVTSENLDGLYVRLTTDGMADGELIPYGGALYRYGGTDATFEDLPVDAQAGTTVTEVTGSGDQRTIKELGSLFISGQNPRIAYLVSNSDYDFCYTVCPRDPATAETFGLSFSQGEIDEAIQVAQDYYQSLIDMESDLSALSPEEAETLTQRNQWLSQGIDISYDMEAACDQILASSVKSHIQTNGPGTVIILQVSVPAAPEESIWSQRIMELTREDRESPWQFKTEGI